MRVYLLQQNNAHAQHVHGNVHILHIFHLVMQYQQDIMGSIYNILGMHNNITIKNIYTHSYEQFLLLHDRKHKIRV